MNDQFEIRELAAEILKKNDSLVTHNIITDNICPTRELIFEGIRKFKGKPKVVIVGQDPYPVPGVATGIAFGINRNQKFPPPALSVIMDEISRYRYDIAVDVDSFDTSLLSWLDQGVLMLNASLTCAPYSPEDFGYLLREGSHSHYWRIVLMEHLIKALDEKYDCVFSFWGQKAQYYAKLVSKNPIENVAHPTADYYNGGKLFRHSKIFDRINSRLKEKNQTIIQW